MRNSVFRLDCVSVSSGHAFRLSDFSIEIREGEIMGLAGPSNAGKTSLCRVLTGGEQRCGGTVFYRDRQIREDRVPREIAKRVALVENDSTLAQGLKVSELLALANPRRGRQLFLDRRWIRREAEHVLRELSIPVEPETMAGELTAAQRHLILIAEAYLQEAELVALDNTISGYTDQEWAAVRRTLQILIQGRTAVLLTSNRETRLTQVCDHIAVLEQGTCLKLFEPQDYGTLRRVMAARRGRAAGRGAVPSPGAGRGGQTVFRVSDLRTESIRAGSFELRRGEITGFYDPNNMAGQELFAALMSMTPSSGRFELENKRLSGMDAVKCMKQGIGFIPDDAVGQGYFYRLSVMDNLLCSSRAKLGASFLFRRRAVAHLAATYAAGLGIDPKDMWLTGDRFGGLERLRIYLRRWDFVRLKLLFCNNILETADLDAREELKGFLRCVAGKGGAVGLFGYDKAGLLEVCDSIYVIENEGHGIGSVLRFAGSIKNRHFC